MSDSDLLHHYKVLKQFLDISDDSASRAKSNSSRAARAREKLLKLSSAQFRELSTDVYDELRRRIDESRSEPDFLLPKSTFHPKRNQARQKLSSLPQSRFKDLVLDISYEIERRNLHRSLPVSIASRPLGQSLARHSYSHSRSVSHASEATPIEAPSRDTSLLLVHEGPQYPVDDLSTKSHSTVDMSNLANSTSLRDDLATPDMKEQVSRQAIGAQPTMIVPTKAEMAWSSDEEDAPRSNRPAAEEPRRLSLSNAFPPSRSLDQPVLQSPLVTSAASVPLEEHQAMKEAYEALVQQHDELSDAHLTLKSQLSSRDVELRDLKDLHTSATSKHEELMHVIDDLKTKNIEHTQSLADLPSPNEIQLLKKEMEDLRSHNASLRLENQSLKSDRSRDSRTLSKELMSPVLDKGLSAEKPLSLNEGLKQFNEKLELLTAAPRQNPGREDLLRNEIALWQEKFEALRRDQFVASTKSPMMATDLQVYISPSGVVPLSMVGHLKLMLETFFLILSDDPIDHILLFEKISLIAITANHIAKFGEGLSQGGEGHSEAIRDAASHALTASRYLATYPTFMPRVVVERSAAEVAFSVLDCISVIKAFDDSKRDSSERNQITTRLINHQTSDTESDFGVKPLKIASKSLGAKSASIPIHSFEQVSPQKKTASNGFAVSAAQQPLNDVKLEKSVKKVETSPELFRSLPLREKIAKLNIAEKSDKQSLDAADSLTNSSLASSTPKDRGTPQQTPKKENAAADNSLVRETHHSPIQHTTERETKASPVQESTPTRNRSIFQSLRDRFTSENKSAPKAESLVSEESLASDSEQPSQETRQLSAENNSKAVPGSFVQPIHATKPTHSESIVNERNGSESVATTTQEPQQEQVESAPAQKTLENGASDAGKSLLSKTGSLLGSRGPQAKGLPMKSPSFKVKKVNYQEEEEASVVEDNEDSYDDEEEEMRQRQDYRKSMAAATFNFDLFDIDDPDNTLTQVLLYLEHQTVQVISTIQDLLTAIKKPNATRGELRDNLSAISEVIRQMTEATNTSMNQTRNFQLKEHGSWVVRSLEDCNHRMRALCKPNTDKNDTEFADRHFKQRLAGISFDIAKCTKELVKTVEEASLKEDIAHLDARLSHADDLT